MRDNSSMDVNKGKRKGMDRNDENAEKKTKIEIKEELCDRCQEKPLVERGSIFLSKKCIDQMEFGKAKNGV